MRPPVPARSRSLVAGLLSALLSAAGLAQTEPTPAPTPLVRSPGNADWAVTLAEARSRAASQEKMVFVEFDRKGCGNCQRMDQLLYPAFDFEALLVPMVPIKLDLDSGEGQTLGFRYEVEETPSVLITTAEGRLVFRMQGFGSTPDFYSHAHQGIDAYKRFAKKVEAQDVAKLSAAEALDTGRELSRRRDPTAALPRLERVGKATDATPTQRDEALELAAACELELGKAAASQRTIQKLIASTKDAQRQERAALFLAQIPLQANDPAEALKRFEAFRKSYPASPYTTQVDAIIKRLRESKPR